MSRHWFTGAVDLRGSIQPARPIAAMPPLLWNQPGLLWSAPGAVWNGSSGPNPTHKTHMSAIVLNLKDLSDIEVEAKLRGLATALQNNPTAAPGIDTTPAILIAAADLIRDKRNAKIAAEAEAEAATAEKVEAVEAGEELIRDYAAEAWKATGKDPTKCTLLAFDVRDPSAPPPPVPNDGQITGLTLDYGPNAGELIAQVDPMPRRRVIEFEVNTTPNAAPTWAFHSSTTAPPHRMGNLPGGSIVQVRARAVFAGGVKGPWSDIAEHRVP